MKKNFVIDNAVEVVVDDCLYDLHNTYDFIKLEIDIESKAVILFFSESGQRNEIKEKKKKTLLIKFHGIEHFEISQNFVNNLTFDLDEIGYKNPLDKNIDWLIDENKSTTDDHMVFRFTNDEFLRIHAEIAYASLD